MESHADEFAAKGAEVRRLYERNGSLFSCEGKELGRVLGIGGKGLEEE